MILSVHASNTQRCLETLTPGFQWTELNKEELELLKSPGMNQRKKVVLLFVMCACMLKCVAG